MNNEGNILEFKNHNISILDRKTININGITKIDSFDKEEFLLDTKLGPLGIKGNDLEIIKLDTFEGTITIKGIINGLTYFDSIKKKKDDTIVSRLFK